MTGNASSLDIAAAAAGAQATTRAVLCAVGAFFITISTSYIAATPAAAQIVHTERVKTFEIGPVKNKREIWKGIGLWGPLLGTKSHVGMAAPKFVYRYRWTQKGQQCSLAFNKLELDVTLTLPEWAYRNANGTTPELRNYFDCVKKTVTIHEHRHADIWLEELERLEDELVAGLANVACDRFQARYKQIYRRSQIRANRRQQAFDKAEYASPRYLRCDNASYMPNAPRRHEVRAKYPDLYNETAEVVDVSEEAGDNVGVDDAGVDDDTTDVTAAQPSDGSVDEASALPTAAELDGALSGGDPAGATGVPIDLGFGQSGGQPAFENTKLAAAAGAILMLVIIGWQLWQRRFAQLGQVEPAAADDAWAAKALANVDREPGRRATSRRDQNWRETANKRRHPSEPVPVAPEASADAMAKPKPVAFGKRRS